MGAHLGIVQKDCLISYLQGGGMGELVKILSIGSISGEDVQFELNSPNNEFAKEQVHIQTKNRRLEMDKDEFIKYASIILLAEKNLKGLKGGR